MQIFVQTLRNKKIVLDIDPLDTIEKVKSLIENKEFLPSKYQRLSFSSKPLLNSKTLSYYNIQNYSTLSLLLDLKGGMESITTNYDNISDKSWMSNIPDDLFLNQIIIPGTHDSCTKNVWTKVAKDTINIVAQCQGCYLDQQLNFGIRLFDIRLGFEDTVSGNLGIFHGPIQFQNSNNHFISFTGELIPTIQNFLRNNPTETVLLQFSYENGNKDKYSENILNWWNSVDKNFYYFKNEIPKLGEVRGKIVILNVGEGLIRRNGFEKWEQTAKNLGISVDGKNKNIIMENHYDVKSHVKKNYIKDYLKKCPKIKIGEKNDIIRICYSNSNIADDFKNTLKSVFTFKAKSIGPQGIADDVNRELRYFRFKKGINYGWWFIDFAEDPNNCNKFYEMPAYYFYKSNIFKNEENNNYISDIWFSVTDRKKIGKDDRKKAMELIIQKKMFINGCDIAAGKGKKFIITGYQISGYKAEGITGLAAVLKRGNINFNGWKWFPIKSNITPNDSQELNKGTGKKTDIYLYYTKDPRAGAPITEINVVREKKGKDYRYYKNLGWDSACWDYSGGSADLKKGTGYDYIYFLFKRIDGSFRV